jgi:hypothetical protein
MPKPFDTSPPMLAALLRAAAARLDPEPVAPPKAAERPSPPPARRHYLDRRADQIAAALAEGDPDQLLSTRETARLLGVSVQFLEIGRNPKYNYGPPYVKLSTRHVRYSRGAIIEWVAARRHASTAEYSTATRAGAAGRKPGSRVVDGRVVEPAEAAP